MMGPDRLLAARAAWVAGICVESRLYLITPHLAGLLDLLERPGVFPPVLRGGMRMLSMVEIPGECDGRVLALAMAVLGSRAEVAAKAHAMTVLRRLAAGCPEILAEVRMRIMEQWTGSGAGFRARARSEFGIFRVIHSG